MKRIDMRIVMVAVAGLAMILLAVGCTTRPEASESLVMEGNHSRGELAMVTADTSSDGYQYLAPQLSLDNERIVFTADWSAVPPPGHQPDPVPLIRQIAIIDVEVELEPLLSAHQAGAEVVHLLPFTFRIGDDPVWISPHTEVQKGDPIWIDDDNILFWIQTPRGARFFRCFVPRGFDSETMISPVVVVREESDEEEFTEIPMWEHYAPALSPDGDWLAYSRFGYVDVDSLNSATGQSLWVARMPEEGQVSTQAFPITHEASMVDQPSWSPDGSKIVFQAALDLTEDSSDFFTHEIFTVDFDTTGLAQSGGVELNRNLERLTFTPPQDGSPISYRNEKPSYSSDGNSIIFVSDRRTPTLTYTDRNIWWIPADGSLDPALVFFTRTDDTDPVFSGRTGDEVLMVSSVGFPTEMLDRLWAEDVQTFLETPLNDPGDLVDPIYPTQVQAEAMANARREELEFFEGVMAHMYFLTDW